MEDSRTTISLLWDNNVSKYFADFSNAVLDRVNFGKANLQGAVFKNSNVFSGSTFVEAQPVKDTIAGYIDLQKRICANTSISPEMEGVSWIYALKF
ncbi:hypothetical protein NC651_033155 [Populus alba x Populus x berolinensis]|nr:hypothetical protein NC651_033155 [Populus alba x Populus x berolinensis]